VNDVADGRSRQAHVVFKAGKNYDGYFDANNFLQQVDNAIDIFEEHTNGFGMGLWLFDNASSHQQCAPDALSAYRMTKNPSNGWAHHKGGPRMQSTILQSGELQDLYFLDDHLAYSGWFKGMEQIICE
jgi:hypothetical protein